MPTEMSKVETEQDKLDKIVNILKEYINGK